MSALFSSRSATGGKRLRIEDRRKSSIADRLSYGLMLSYKHATGAADSDTFIRDAKTWAAFEHAVMAEMNRYSFFDQRAQRQVEPQTSLSEAMLHIWTSTNLDSATAGTTKTGEAIRALATFLCSMYEVKTIDRRTQRRRFFSK